MEATQVSLSEQLAEARKRLAETSAKRSEYEVALQQAHTWLGEAQTRRSGFVKELAGADDSTTGFLEEQIDEVDREIVSHQRFIESHTIRLANIVAEGHSFQAEASALAKAVAEQEREAAFKTWTEQLEQAVQTAGKDADALRLSLARIATLLDMVHAEFNDDSPESNFLHARAKRSAEALIVPFGASQKSPESKGWKILSRTGFLFGELRLSIWPAQKDSK